MKVIHILPSFTIPQAGLFYAVKGLAQFKSVETEIWTWTFDYSAVSVKKIRLASLMWNFFKARNAEVVCHFHGCWSFKLFVGVLVAKFLKKPVYFHPHGMLSPWALSHRRTRKQFALILFQTRMLCLADRIVCSSWIEQRELNLLRGSWAPKIVCIPNGVEPPRVQRVPWLFNKTLGFLSRLHEKKGVLQLISAFSASDLMEWNLVIGGYGEPDFVRECEALARFSNKTIHFLGAITDDMKDQFFMEIDYLVLPSLSENFGIVVAESLARGVPVLTTQNTPWFNDADTGVIEIHTDSIELSSELSSVATINSENYAALSELAVKHAAKFYWPEIEHRYIDEYVEFLGCSPR